MYTFALWIHTGDINPLLKLVFNFFFSAVHVLCHIFKRIFWIMKQYISLTTSVYNQKNKFLKYFGQQGHLLRHNMVINHNNISQQLPNRKHQNSNHTTQIINTTCITFKTSWEKRYYFFFSLSAMEWKLYIKKQQNNFQASRRPSRASASLGSHKTTDSLGCVSLRLPASRPIYCLAGGQHGRVQVDKKKEKELKKIT